MESRIQADGPEGNGVRVGSEVGSPRDPYRGQSSQPSHLENHSISSGPDELGCPLDHCRQQSMDGRHLVCRSGPGFGAEPLRRSPSPCLWTAQTKSPQRGLFVQEANLRRLWLFWPFSFSLFWLSFQPLGQHWCCLVWRWQVPQQGQARRLGQQALREPLAGPSSNWAGSTKWRWPGSRGVFS